MASKRYARTNTHPASKPLDHDTGRGRSRTVPQPLVSSASDTLDEEVMGHAVEPYRLDGPMMVAQMGDAAEGQWSTPRRGWLTSVCWHIAEDAAAAAAEGHGHSRRWSRTSPADDHERTIVEPGRQR
jgi:hypothetical protein